MTRAPSLQEENLGFRTSNLHMVPGQNLTHTLGDSDQLPNSSLKENESGKYDQKERKRVHDRMNQRASRK